jgi:hypothetical protein
MNDRAGRILALVVGGLVLLAVVAGVLSASRGDQVFPAGSPEAAVQDYLSRLYDGDLEGATALLDPADGCTVEDLERSLYRPDARVVLRSSRVSGETATVRVELVHGEGGLLGSDGWTQDETLRLARVDGRWVVSADSWPVHGCPDRPGARP